MFVPSCAAALTLVLVSACGGATESSSATPKQPPGEQLPELPSAERLQGEWKQEYITAGALYMNSRLRFEANGALTRDAVSMTSFTEPNTVTHYEGSYRDSGRGSVEYEWATETGRTQYEHSLTFVEAALLAHHCCNRAATDLWWSHRGYLATNPARSKFQRTAAQRVFELDGTPRSSLETRVGFTFSDVPAKLVGRSDGVLELAVVIESIAPEGSEFHDVRLSFPCRVQADGGDTLVVLVPGWDVADGRSLTEQAYRARGLWHSIVAERVDTEGWSERTRGELLKAFEPYLAFDRAHPNLMVHYVEWSSLDVTGYARVPD